MSNTCEHYFTFGEEREPTCCLGSHRVNKCTLCGIEYMDAVCKAINDFYKKGGIVESYTEPDNHFHVWDKNGNCGSKLNFHDDENGNNYGFRTVSYGKIEIPERRKCNAKNAKK